MTDIEIIDSLNKTLSSSPTPNVNSSAEFYSVDKFPDVLKTVAPFGKVAVVYLKSSFESFGKEVTFLINKIGSRPINFVMPTSVKLSLETIFDVIGIPEDVRAIIYFDGELAPIINYLATVLSLTAIRIIKDFNTDDVLAPIVFFNNENGADLFPITCKNYVLIDFPSVKKSDPEYAVNYIFSRYLSSIDYKLFCAANGKENEYSAEIDAAVDFCKNFIDGKNSDKGELLYRALKIENSERVFGGEPLKNSVLFSLKRLSKKTERSLFDQIATLKISEIYLLFLSGKAEGLLNVPDYVCRANFISEKTGLSVSSVADGIISQREKLRSEGQKISLALTDIKKGAQRLIDISAYYTSALSKEADAPRINLKEYAAALKSSGDMPDTFNMFTLVRESGMSELF